MKHQKVKCLPLELWMNTNCTYNSVKEMILNGHLKQVSAVFNRNGWYLQNGKSWFESNGISCEADVDMFIYKLDIFNASEIDKKTSDILLMFAKTKFATKKQKKLAYTIKSYRSLLEIKKQGKILKLEVKKIKNQTI
jgi:hypothetical protein